METMFILAGGACWNSVMWRFRGGGFTALTGIDPGTGGMRAIAAVGMTAPLVMLGGWAWAVMIPALWIGWSIAGWGAFQGMGKSPVGDKNRLERLLSRFLSPVPMCLVGMGIEGAYTMTLPGVAAGWCAGSAPIGALVMMSGVGFSPIYWFSQSRKSTPDLGRFEHGGSELAECLVGLWIGFVLTLAVVSTALALTRVGHGIINLSKCGISAPSINPVIPPYAAPRKYDCLSIWVGSGGAGRRSPSGGFHAAAPSA